MQRVAFQSPNLFALHYTHKQRVPELVVTLMNASQARKHDDIPCRKGQVSASTLKTIHLCRNGPLLVLAFHLSSWVSSHLLLSLAPSFLLPAHLPFCSYFSQHLWLFSLSHIRTVLVAQAWFVSSPHRSSANCHMLALKCVRLCFGIVELELWDM